MSVLRVITALYGTSHLPFTQVLLESLYRVAVPHVDLVHWGLSEGELRSLYMPYSTVTPIALSPEVGEELLRQTGDARVSRKLLAWEWGLAHTEDGDGIVFLDADTLVLQYGGHQNPLGLPFALSTASLFYTVREGRWPLNSGVVFMRVLPETRLFVRRWRELTEAILAGPERDALRGRYGGADQAALEALRQRAQISMYPLSARVWNMDRCVLSLEETAIFHLKGCLPLLLGQRSYGTEYGDERTPETCEPLFTFWRELRRDHLERDRQPC